MSDKDTTEKTYGGYLLINWRDDSVRFRKTEPTSLAPSEIAVPVSVSVNVPKIEVPSLEVDIDVPPAAVEHVVVEESERVDPVFDE